MMPGGSICSVAIYKNNSKKAGCSFMFFTFPKNPQIRNEWIKKCYRRDKFNPKNKRVCSQHFVLHDYDDEMQASIMGLQPRKLKKNTAIPSQHLLPRIENKSSSER